MIISIVARIILKREDYWGRQNHGGVAHSDIVAPAIITQKTSYFSSITTREQNDPPTFYKINRRPLFIHT